MKALEIYLKSGARIQVPASEVKIGYDALANVNSISITHAANVKSVLFHVVPGEIAAIVELS